MQNNKPYRIVRLNAGTMPMRPLERDILAPLQADIIEIEGDTDDAILAAACDADAIMIISAYLHANVVASLQRCQIISRLGTGVDKIDVDEATRKGIIVNNLPGVFTDEVADHTLALLLATARELKLMDQTMRQGCRPSGVNTIHRLSVQTAGIIGFGRIGQAVAQRCRAFGLKVLAYDPCVPADVMKEHQATPADLATLLRESDYVCPLCPLTPETRAMISLKELRQMKPTAALINAGRGELVNEDDLAAALQLGIIRCAALDVFGIVNVFSAHGFPTRHPLFKLENVLLSPHVAAQSEEATEDCLRRGAQAVVDVLSGRWPEHPVNPHVTPRQNLIDPVKS